MDQHMIAVKLAQANYYAQVAIVLSNQQIALAATPGIPNSEIEPYEKGIERNLAKARDLLNGIAARMEINGVQEL